jgi:hypothetical protein
VARAERSAFSIPRTAGDRLSRRQHALLLMWSSRRLGLNRCDDRSGRLRASAPTIGSRARACRVKSATRTATRRVEDEHSAEEDAPLAPLSRESPGGAERQPRQSGSGRRRPPRSTPDAWRPCCRLPVSAMRTSRLPCSGTRRRVSGHSATLRVAPAIQHPSPLRGRRHPNARPGPARFPAPSAAPPPRPISLPTRVLAATRATGSPQRRGAPGSAGPRRDGGP